MTSTARATLGTAAFFVLAPGLTAGLGPWLLTGWEVRQPFPHWLPLRVLGVVLIVTGALVLVPSFVRFVAEGGGTPAPVAPTERLVVGGYYRYVRNPMYLAVIALVLGQALLLAQPSLFVYTAVVAVAVISFAHWYERPALQRRFGHEYERYRRAVPGWWPRRRPWQAPDGG
jgi:protein-S-isoprenylcysteine O-methyltransferase Ste14